MSEADVWEDLGFTRNPYDYRPLRVNQEDRAIFVGRSNEQNQFKLQVAGTQGGLIIVEGGTGVGKTSFVNSMQYDKWRGGRRQCLPSFETLELNERVELTDFMLSALSNCVFSLEKIHGSTAVDDEQDLRAGKELIANTVRSGGGLSITVLGTGGGASKQVAPVSPPSVVLPTIIHTMNRWFERAAEKFGYEGFLVPINNLDILPDDTVTGFLNSARDTLLTRQRVWWILISRQGFFQTLEVTARRVSELVTGTPVYLAPLSLREVHDAADIRIERFKKTMGATAPVPPEAIDLLYEASNGEIRYIFKRLSDLVYQFRLVLPSERQIPLTAAIELLKGLARRRISELNLTQRDQQILKKIAAKGRFRIRDHTDLGLSKPQLLMKSVNKFMRLSLLGREEKSRREVWYYPTGDVNLVFR